MTKVKKLSFMTAAVGIFLFSNAVLHADIVIEPAFTGSLIITSPEGEINIVQAGESVPQILNDSTIEIFNGGFTLNLGAGDSVSVSCGKQSAGIGAGGSASVTCGEKEGTLKVIQGPIRFLGTGADTLLKEGREYPFGYGALEKKAAPTADTQDSTGTNPAGDPPVDSRSIQSSQSQ